MFLTSQNKALVLEMKRYKRQISESRRELELMRSKSREMEALVSIIQRAWSQVSLTVQTYLYHQIFHFIALSLII